MKHLNDSSIPLNNRHAKSWDLIASQSVQFPEKMRGEIGKQNTLLAKTTWSFLILETIASTASRHQRRKSVQTWSFLLRAVWSFFAGSPTKSVSAASMFMCTSSRSVLHSNSPLSICSLITSRPSKILSLSSSVINPYNNNSSSGTINGEQQIRMVSERRYEYLTSKHWGVGAAAHDVVLVEGFIEWDRLGEFLDGVGDAVLEAASPELGLLGAHLHGGGGECAARNRRGGSGDSENGGGGEGFGEKWKGFGGGKQQWLHYHALGQMGCAHFTLSGSGFQSISFRRLKC